jgi:hypothetical protein
MRTILDTDKVQSTKYEVAMKGVRLVTLIWNLTGQTAWKITRGREHD